MKHIRLIKDSTVAFSGFVLGMGLLCSHAIAQPPPFNWDQWGQNPQHQGFVNVVAQSLSHELANMVYDSFVPLEQADQGGGLIVHYQATLLHQQDAYMMFKSGTYTPIQFDINGNPINQETHWDSQIWNEKRLHWEGGVLVEKWNFQSDWKPEPDTLVGGWEPVFHAALVGDFIYVPGAHGTVWKLNTGDGSVAARINPGYPTVAGATVYVAGPLSADGNGNIFFNALQLDFDPANPTVGSQTTVDSWLVRIDPSDNASKASYSALVLNQPTSCVRSVNNNYLPWPGVTNANSGHDTTSPYNPNFIRGFAPCGAQRPGINVAPAFALDGTIYTASTADFNTRYSYVVAVNPDLTPKWQASLRDLGINDGCGVSIPIATAQNPIQKGHCRFGNYTGHIGVDPATNQMPAGRVIDQSSSSPTVLPDGSVIYGAYSRYNVARGHFFKFSSTGSFISWFDFGWDSTPAVWPHDGTFSVVAKDNHYDEESGFYCNNFQGNRPVSNIVCDCDQCDTHDPIGAPAGPFYITQLSGTQTEQFCTSFGCGGNNHMVAEWKFHSTNTNSCVGDEQPQHCTPNTHPNGFEWCINAPAVDANGTVYNNSEDGRLYSLPQGHTGVWNDSTPGPAATHFFTNLALGAAYTPLAIDAQGRIFTQNDGHLFVIGD